MLCSFVGFVVTFFDSFVCVCWILAFFSFYLVMCSSQAHARGTKTFFLCFSYATKNLLYKNEKKGHRHRRRSSYGNKRQSIAALFLTQAAAAPLLRPTQLPPSHEKNIQTGCEGWATKAPSMLPQRAAFSGLRYHSIVSRRPSSQEICGDRVDFEWFM